MSSDVGGKICLAAREREAAATELRCLDVAAIRHFLMTDQLQHPVAEMIEIGAVAAFEWFSSATSAVQA